ncbi:MAG: KEOPS complex kinase/ATPase Bud32 [Methanomassiliicoccales archaeon]
MEVIRRGAEAEIRSGRWMGRPVVIKSRVAKAYRHPELDSRLRAQRTRNEARLIQEARRNGVPTPLIYDIDLERAEITMQDLGRSRVKDLLSQGSPEEARSLCREMGELTARLHRNDMVHGDLTTSNMLLREGIWLIDFSLGATGATMEEKGVDLHLLREAFLSAHSEIFDLFQEVLESYQSAYMGSDEVMDKVRQIERRGRYT